MTAIYTAMIDCPRCLDPFIASWEPPRKQEVNRCPRCGHVFMSVFPGLSADKKAALARLLS
jgi:DNA-directed RNA polymerase subunit RPC12/RpoP